MSIGKEGVNIKADNDVSIGNQQRSKKKINEVEGHKAN